MKKIILVDDKEIFRKSLAETLKTVGEIEIIGEASNGKEFLELLKTKQPEIVFMDIEMPVMNGIETTDYIRKEMEYPLNIIPIIALTAHNPDIFFEDFADVGFDELITKPYSIDKIKEKIESAMNQTKK